MKIFQNRIEKDFEFFVKSLPALEPIEFCGLAKILSVSMVKTELVDFDKERWNEIKENDEMKAKIQESLVPMDEVLEQMMDKYLELPKRRRKEINKILKDIKKAKKEVKTDGTTT